MLWKPLSKLIKEIYEDKKASNHYDGFNCESHKYIIDYGRIINYGNMNVSLGKDCWNFVEA